MKQSDIIETKKNSNRSATLNTRVYACANRLTTIPSEIQSRFMILHLKEYDNASFREVIIRTLTRRENVKPKLAEYIAEKVLSMDTKDVRTAIRISRLAKSKSQVNMIMKTIDKYSR